MKAPRPFVASLQLALVMALSGCGSCGGQASPPKDGIAVAVEIDGATSITIDRAMLDGRKPDFQDELGHRAWALGQLLGARYDPARHGVQLEDLEGKRHGLTTPGEDLEGGVVVVEINKSGKLRVTVVSPDDPFPPYHGRGGNRGRQGDATRVKGVKRIVLFSPS